MRKKLFIVINHALVIKDAFSSFNFIVDNSEPGGLK